LNLGEIFGDSLHSDRKGGFLTCPNCRTKVPRSNIQLLTGISAVYKCQKCSHDFEVREYIKNGKVTTRKYFDLTSD